MEMTSLKLKYRPIHQEDIVLIRWDRITKDCEKYTRPGSKVLENCFFMILQFCLQTQKLANVSEFSIEPVELKAEVYSA